MLNDATSIIETELDPGEVLLWAAQPRQGVRFQSSDFFMIPFSLIWCGFAIFWETIVLVVDAPLIFKLWGIPFVIVGLYMVIGRFFLDSRRRAATWYGLTDRRVLIVTGASERKITSLPLHTLDHVALTEKKDGSGTISFTSAPPSAVPMPQVIPARWARADDGGRSLVMIENAREVHDAIRRVQRIALDQSAPVE